MSPERTGGIGTLPAREHWNSEWGPSLCVIVSGGGGEARGAWSGFLGRVYLY